jgi:uncharacterized Rossmann fold enzyme
MSASLLSHPFKVTCIQGITPLIRAPEEREYLAVFEEEAPLVAELMSTEEGRTLLSHPRVRIYLLSQENEEEVIGTFLKEFAFFSFSYVGTKNETLFSRIEACRVKEELSLAEYGRVDGRVFKNLCRNIRSSRGALDARALKGVCKGIPAIICGAGPSLEENIDQLKSLENKALIFSGGAGLNVLSSYGITPHFAAGFDPHPPYRRFHEQTHFETPFFYQMRACHELLFLVQGEKLLLPRIAASEIEQWGNEAMGGVDGFAAGWTVANFCVAIAAYLGCSPIILTGVDFAFKEGRKYAPGVRGDCDLAMQKEWPLAKAWLESFAADHPDITWFNVGQYAPFAEIRERHLQRSFDLEGHVHAALQALPHVERAEASVDAIEHSLHRSLLLCKQMIALMETAYPHPGHLHGSYALAEVELQEEIAFRYILEPVWRVWQPLFQRETIAYPQLNQMLFFKQLIEAHL